MTAPTSLEALERAVANRQPDAHRLLLQSLFDLAAGRLCTPGTAPPSALSARLAAAAGALLAQVDLPLATRDAEQLLVMRPTLDQVFKMSAFGSSDCFVAAMGPPDVMPTAVATLLKRIILQSVDSELAFPVDEIFRLPPKLAELAAVGIASTKPVGSRRGYDRIGQVVGRADRLQGASLPIDGDTVVQVSAAWMLCSYAAADRKHALKASLNRSLRHMALALGLHDRPLKPPPPPGVRPRMVVAAEIMRSSHVQYRYFGQYLRQLRTRFDLVLVTEAGEDDAHVRPLFDAVHTFRRSHDGSHFRPIFDAIDAADPDILFWPSLGMRHWGPVMCNLRLAPIQVTALGHSASSFCDYVDYYMVEEGYVADPSRLSEIVIGLPDESLVFERPPLKPAPPAARRAEDGVVRVAMPSNILKLNPEFLSLIDEIVAEAGVEVECRVFPNAGGLELQAFLAEIAKRETNYVVYSHLSYADYSERLAECDVCLSPYPFGGLHSVVDSLRYGIPVVAMECPELHGMTDAMLLRRLGLPEWLIARSREAYKAVALDLLRNPVVRKAVSELALGARVDQTLFGDATTPLRTEVVDAFDWVLANHSALSSQPKRFWSAADRASHPRL